MLHSLYDIIEPGIRSFPERIALVTPGGEKLSYRKLDDILTAYAARAAAAGISRGDRVALHAVSMTQYLLLMLALSRLGSVHVRTPEEDPEQQAGIGADRIVVDAESKLRGPKVVPLDLRWPDRTESSDRLPMPGFDTEDEICLVINTSGTTGRKKQIGYSLALAKSRMEDSEITEEMSGQFQNPPMRVLSHIPPTAALGQQVALRTLRRGNQLIMPGRTNFNTLAMMLDGQVDEIVAPPAIFARWVEYLKIEGIKLRSIKRALIGGSFASRDLLMSVQTYICENLFSKYGSSEVGPCACSHVDAIASIPGAVGKLADWVEARAVDDKGDALPAGQFGMLQLRLKGGRKMAPYVDDGMKAPAVSREWFVPGDVGAVTAEGVLCIEGRHTDLMNVGGNKIAPSLVEEIVARQMGEAGSVCVLGLPGANGFDEVVVVVASKTARDLNQLAAQIERSNLGLGRFHMLATKSFPLNESGKIDRNKLRTMISAEIARRRSQQTSR